MRLMPFWHYFPYWRIWKKSRYISSDMQTLISFTKKYYQMHSLIPSDKKTNGD